jgi:glycosyltransferase involved in cell wall biosynthesis
MYKLSVITVNFNNSAGLRNTVESVIAQSFNDLEFLIIDGGSTDGSIEVIKQFEDKITYWVSEADRGIYHAMNKGIIKAKGEYLLFLNSGDFLVSKDIITDIFSINCESDLIMGNLVTKDNYEIKLDFSINFANIWKYGAHHQAMFIKRKLFEQIGFYNENGDITADWQFLMLVLFKFKKKFTYLDKIISVYDMHGISANPVNRNRIAAEKKKFMKVNFRNHPQFLLQSIIFIRKNYQRICSIPTRINRFVTPITNN